MRGKMIKHTFRDGKFVTGVCCLAVNVNSTSVKFRMFEEDVDTVLR